MGLDPRTPGSRPGPKAGAKPLSHPGIPFVVILKKVSSKFKKQNRTLCGLKPHRQLFGGSRKKQAPGHPSLFCPWDPQIRSTPVDLVYPVVYSGVWWYIHTQEKKIQSRKHDLYTNIFVYKKCTSVYLQSRFHQRDRWLSPPPCIKDISPKDYRTQNVSLWNQKGPRH